MTFIAEGKPTYRVYDKDKDLEWKPKHGGPAFHSHGFFKYSEPSVYLGGGILWTAYNRSLSLDERLESPYEGYTRLYTITIDGPWWAEGPFQLPNYGIAETIEVIQEALIASSVALLASSETKFEIVLSDKMQRLKNSSMS